MKFAAYSIYHIYNQGNNQQIIFHIPEDYMIFLRLVRRYISPHAEIIAWCLMPNHFHFLIYADEKACIMIKQGGIEIEKLTNGIRKLLSSYARIFNKRYNQTGSLFRQKTKAKNIQEEEGVVTNKYTFHDYCSKCFLYIHQNPVAAGLVKVAADWKFSSCLDYAGLRNGTLCNKELAEKYCSYNFRDYKDGSNKNAPGDF